MGASAVGEGRSLAAGGGEGTRPLARPPSSPKAEADVAARPAVWRELGFWTLFLLVLATYFARMDEVGLRHEEPHRGQVGWEMVATGDWIVPRQQGEPFLSRPPLQNWVIAGTALLRGELDTVAIRLHSALAVLATALLVYAYARRFLGPLGAFAAGASYATMGQVLELGRKGGETEVFFAFLVSASLLVWHGGAARGPASTRTWVVAYLFAALGTLTKGPQAPVYFGAAVLVYLVLRRRWRELFRAGNFVGFGVYAAVVLAWLVPYWQRMGTAGVRKIFFGDVGLRFVDQGPSDAFVHLFTYPLEVLSSTLPWSALLLVYASGAFRRSLGRFSEAAFFIAVALAVSFPSVWFPPGAHARYFMPLYPLMAVLVGAVVERSAAAREGSWRDVHSWFQVGTGALAAVLGAGVVGARLVAAEGSAFDQPPAFVALFAAGAGAVSWICFRAAALGGTRAAAASTAAVATLAGLVSTGLLVNAYTLTGEDTEGQMAALRDALPPDAELRSLDRVDPLFVHYYGEPIERVPWESWPAEEPPDTEYFCIDPYFSGRSIDELRFPWELVGTVVCDFTRHDVPRRPVYVGRVVHPSG